MLPHRSPYAHALLLALALAGLLVVPRAAPASPETVAVQAGPRAFLAYTDQPVSLVATDVAVPSTGSLDYTAVVTLDEPTDYLQVRLQVRRPSGRLLYQKTQIQNDAEAGVRTFRFTRPLGDLELRPDAYPVELSVIADGRPIKEWSVEGTLRVYDPKTAPLPVALIVKVVSPPQTDPQGRFVSDPALETAARDAVRKLSDAVISTPGLRVSLAIAPVLLEEWRHVGQGYEVATAGGVVSVAADDPTAVSYSQTLVRLREAVGTSRLELLDVPYADPSPQGLQQVGRQGDLQAHLELGRSAYSAALDASPSAGTYLAGGMLSTRLAQDAYAGGVRYAVALGDYVRRSSETSAPPGTYQTQTGPRTALLVPDQTLTSSAAQGSTTGLLDGLFTHAIAAKRPAALPLAIEVGPGSPDTLTALLPQLPQAATAAWLKTITAREAAETARPASLSVAQSLPPDENAPAELWTEIATARELAVAYRSACPAEDQDAGAAEVDSLISECAYWAGRDGQWALADRARGFAASAQRRAEATFDRLTITAENVTLSGSSGSVPFSITNGTDKTLQVVVSAAGPAVRSPFANRQTLPPGDTYLIAPVDLRQSIQKTATLTLTSGKVVISTRTVTVRASYLDRLAIIGAIVLVLLGMLLYISRRVRRAENRDTD